MSLLDALRYRLRTLRDRDAYDRELDEELDHFVALDEQARGLSASLGAHTNRTHLNEERRIMSGIAFVDAAKQDVRFALRFLSRRRMQASVTIVTLALGIGAATSIFSVADAVLFRPLAFRDADALITIWRTRPDVRLIPGRGAAWDRFMFSIPTIRRWNAKQHSFSSIAGWTTSTTLVAGDDGAEELSIMHASASLLPTLGVQAELGRNFAASEDAIGGVPVALVSHEVWARAFGSDNQVIGKHVAIDGTSYAIIGVLPAGITLDRTTSPAAYWIPAGQDPDAGDDGTDNYRVIARLAPGVGLGAAIDETTRLSGEWSKLDANAGLRFATLKDEQTRKVKAVLLILLSASGLLLLIACANVAIVLMSESAVRDRELRARLALGATRRRLMRQLLTESVVLSTIGGVAGTLVALAGTKIIVALAPRGIPGLADVRVDARVLGAALVVSLVTGLVVGIVPALFMSRTTASLDGRVTAPRGRAQSQRALVAIEVALSVTLLVGAALLVESFERLASIEPGFRRDHVYAMRMRLPRPEFADTIRERAFYAELLERVRAIPGVDRAAATTSPPFSGGSSSSSYQIEGRVAAAGQSDAQRRVTTPDYFATAGIPLVAGRAYDAHDATDGPPVIVVSQSLARREWPGETALGKRIKWMGTTRTVIGVAADVKLHGLLDGALPTIYTPLAQLLRGDPWVVAHVRGEESSMPAALRAAVHATSATVAVGSIDEMSHMVDASLDDDRFRTRLITTFAAIAALLATVGMYGVASAAANRRTQELAIRAALGASNASIVGLIVRAATNGVIAGGVLGVLLASLGTRALVPYLYGVGQTDPRAYVSVVVLLGATALVATWIPARRATRMSLVAALRGD